MSRRADILGALEQAETGFVSGRRLAELLGISRNAVWKHVVALRERGYVIESSHAKGYRLESMPKTIDAENLKSLLTSNTVGANPVCYDITGSTNDDARRLAREGAPDGTVVIADAQSAGRGRLGRQWVSRPAINLYTSIVLRPKLAPADAPQLSLVAGVAVAKTLEKHGIMPGIKWPNDVVVGGQKICGVLTEMEAEENRVDFVVVGIGVNLNAEPEDFPPELAGMATSVKIERDKDVDRTRFAAALYGEFELAYERFVGGGFGALIDDWNARATLVGKPVEVAGGVGPMRGTCVGIDAEGALLLRLEDGETVEKIVAGDVTIVGGYGNDR